ncbi:MAG: hypothetical protein U5K00_13405 [Melioribacteraceae bacterium]|nr:hypothetical protein [Melioribacteraceae bacterium]
MSFGYGYSYWNNPYWWDHYYSPYLVGPYFGYYPYHYSYWSSPYNYYPGYYYGGGYAYQPSTHKWRNNRTTKLRDTGRGRSVEDDGRGRIITTDGALRGGSSDGGRTVKNGRNNERDLDATRSRDVVDNRRKGVIPRTGRTVDEPRDRTTGNSKCYRKNSENC